MYAHLSDISDDELFRTTLLDHLEQTFPKKAAAFQDSLAEQTIRALESFLSQFVESSFAEIHQEHQRVFLKIKQAFAGLESMIFSPPPSPIRDKGSGRRRGMSQQELKRANVKQPAIDEKPFQILGIHPPSSLQEYEDIIERLMVTLKRILSVSIPLGDSLTAILTISFRITSRIWANLRCSNIASMSSCRLHKPPRLPRAERRI